MASGSEPLIANVSLPFLPASKFTSASPLEGTTHHGEPGRSPSRTKDRGAWSRKNRSAAPNRTGSVRVGLEARRNQHGIDVLRVDSDIGRLDPLGHLRASAELPELFALGLRAGPDVHDAFPDEHHRRRPQLPHGREERAPVHVQVEVLEAQPQAVRAEARGVEGEMDQPVDPAGLRAFGQSPSPGAALQTHRERLDAGGQAVDEHHLRVEERLVGVRGQGRALDADLDLRREEGLPGEIGLLVPLALAVEIPQGKIGGDVARPPGGVQGVQEGAGIVRGGGRRRGPEEGRESDDEDRSLQAVAS